VSKRKQKKSSGRGDAIAQVRKTLAVAVALARAKVLRAVLQGEIDRHGGTGLPELGPDDWREFRVTDATRLATLMIAYFTALDAVVEGWKINGLADDRVDKLLQSSHAQTLSGFRNALVHPRSLVDERLNNMHADRKEVLRWAAELANTMESAFSEWYAAIAAKGNSGSAPTDA
jgi:hypothetical protein